MNYENTEISVNGLVQQVNQKEINLSPMYQRGSKWSLKERQALIRNMVLRRPIPAIFLFDQGKDIKTLSWVLDGKQRLESLILFIGNGRTGAKITSPKAFFFQKDHVLENLHFGVQLEKDGPLVKFADLDAELARKFLNYRIALIKVDFPDDEGDEQTNLADVIELFIDINKTGRKVSKIEIARALNISVNADPLFKSLLKMVGEVTPRGQGRSVFNRPIHTDYTYVLKRLRDVERTEDSKTKLDIMWERLHELALFVQTGSHRAPSDILKGLISGTQHPRLTIAQQKKLKGLFAFIKTAYKSSRLLELSKFATDQPQFYTMATTLLSSDLMTTVPHADLVVALQQFADYANGVQVAPDNDISVYASNYIAATGKQTTHTNKRKDRQLALQNGIRAIVALSGAVAVGV